jgi:hypothetical protein
VYVGSTLDVAGDASITGDLSVLGTTTTIDTDNLRVKDPIIELGKGNDGTLVDLGLVMTRPSGSSNVAVIFDESTDILEIGYTNGDASQSTITMDSAPLSVKINGDLSVSSNVEVGTANLFVDTTTSNVGIGTNTPLDTLHINGGTRFAGHIIPTTNATFDIGSAENKVRDLYVDTNSIWVGDRAKIAFENGKMKFKRRKLNKVPRMLVNLAISGGRTDEVDVETHAIAFAQTKDSSISSVSDLKLEHLRDYAKTFDNTKSVSDIFADNEEDYEAITASEAFIEVGSNIFTEHSLSIGKTTNPTSALDVEGDVVIQPESQSVTFADVYNRTYSSFEYLGVSWSPPPRPYGSAATAIYSKRVKYTSTGGLKVSPPDTGNQVYYNLTASRGYYINMIGYRWETELGIGSVASPYLSGDVFSSTRFKNYDQEDFTGFAIGQEYTPGNITGDLHQPVPKLARYHSAHMYFKTASPDGTLTEKMRITNTGNVGIGTTSPATKLHVEHYGSAIGDFEGIRIANHASLLHASSRPAYEFVVSDIDAGTGIGNGKFAIGYRGTTSASRTDRLVIDNSGNVGIGLTDPDGTLHVKAGNRVHITEGTTPAFTGLEPASQGRAQLVLNSRYSDLVIASSYVNNAHGSTLSFTTVNPDNTAEYRKFVINQGNWGSRKDFLDFGLSASAADANPHIAINSTDTVLTLDGNNKRVGIGKTNPTQILHIVSNTEIPLFEGDGGRAVNLRDSYALVCQGGNQTFAWGSYPSVVKTVGNGEFRFHSSNGEVSIRVDGSYLPFTGSHDTYHYYDESDEGKLVYATGDYESDLKTGVYRNEIDIMQACPTVSLCTRERDKRVVGVLATRTPQTETREITEEEYQGLENEQRYAYSKKDSSNTYVAHIDTNEYSKGMYNALGEGGIWVSNKNGNFENGDYITSSTIPGYGQRQDDDILRNYTAAKITTDCDFTEVLDIKRKRLQIGNNYQYDENKQPLYENILDEEGNMITQPKFKLRYILPDGTEITKEQYTTAEEAYIAAFVGCTYHCG